MKKLKNTPWFYDFLAFGGLWIASNSYPFMEPNLETYGILFIILNFGFIALSIYFFIVGSKKRKDDKAEKIILTSKQIWIGICIIGIFVASTEFFIFS